MSGYLVPDKPLMRWLGAPKFDRKNAQPVQKLEVELQGKRPVRITLVGHSFLTHILSQVENEVGDEHNFGLRPSVAQMSYLVKGGKKLKHFDEHTIMAYNPDIVYFEIGSNDLSELEKTGNQMGRVLYDLAVKLISMGVKKVIAGEVIYRQADGVPNSKPEYNYEVQNMNWYLQSTMAESNNPRCFFWRHKNIWEASAIIYMDDGIHLNSLGNERMFRSIRGALLRFMREIKDEL